MDEKRRMNEDRFQEEATTFEIHPDDVKAVPEDFDLEWNDKDEDIKKDKEDEQVEPFEAFEEKVLKGLEILSKIKATILHRDHQGAVTETD